jgi:Cys-rich repeat protein
MGMVCDTANYHCVASCTTDAQCGRGNPYCNAATMRCVQCLSSMQCAAGATQGGLAGAVCDTATNRCVQCLSAADCAMNQGNPYCDTANDRCSECLTDANCPMGQTCANGRCN